MLQWELIIFGGDENVDFLVEGDFFDPSKICQGWGALNFFNVTTLKGGSGLQKLCTITKPIKFEHTEGIRITNKSGIWMVWSRLIVELSVTKWSSQLTNDVQFRDFLPAILKSLNQMVRCSDPHCITKNLLFSDNLFRWFLKLTSGLIFKAFFQSAHFFIKNIL